ncbi:MAG: hypothetical protein IPG01_13365 [Chitinophagaceae bacterium]|nr:hypothetical protein [Chitinophagaceae bacterium]
MSKFNHSANIAQQTIFRLVEKLLNLFTMCKSLNEEIAALKEKLSVLDQTNPDFFEILEDRRESTKMSWRFIIIFLSMCIDFFLLYNGMTILCHQFGWPVILKILIPAFLIVTEIGISYFSIIQNRSGEGSSWIIRNLQYFVLVILVALTFLVILYSAQEYSETVDGVSFLTFFTGTVIIQISLLVASLMLHLWLIRNGEAIAEIFAYMRYRIDRRKLAGRIDQVERENRDKNLPDFTKDTHSLVQKIEAFRRDFPMIKIDFERTIPADLIRAINRVMGKAFLESGSSNNSDKVK